MRTIRFLPFLWIAGGLSQDSGGFGSVVAQLPACAQTCLATHIKSSPCEATDLPCICAETQLQHDVEICVLASCTLRQSLATKNATTTACHAPIRSQQQEARVQNIALAATTAFCVLARIIYKAAFSIGELGWDDYTLLLALLAGVPSVVVIDRLIVPNGLAQDVWTVPFDHITTFVHYLYVLEILYFLQIAFTKLTLLLFFVRIFPKPLVRKLLWATIAFVSLWGATYVLVAIFQCRPISFYWTNWDKQGQGGQCIDINAFAFSNAAISIALDVWMLALPLWEVFHLQMSWRKKLSVATMFFVGTFVTIVSGLRLHSLFLFAETINPTWDQAEVIKWSNIEINVGLICVCLPALRLILVRMFPRAFGSSKDSHGYTHYGTSMGRPSVLRSVASKHASYAGDPGAITFTKTFDVQHGENDEVSLVQLDEFGHKTKGRSSTTSVSSL